jgi:hypothetical protein
MYGFDRNSDSICSQRVPVDYWWINGGAVNGEGAIDTILDLVERLLAGWDWTHYALEEELGYLAELLERAGRGQLEPLTEIKPIQRKFFYRMFEIRHQVSVVQTTRMMGKVIDRRESAEHVRIYHAEGGTLPTGHALAAHVHLKQIMPDDTRTRELQNTEIDRAVEVLTVGASNHWGIPR